MTTISLEGLPDPVVRSLEALVETVRREMRAAQVQRHRVELPRWPGKVIGSLTREEIYEDAGRLSPG